MKCLSDLNKNLLLFEAPSYLRAKFLVKKTSLYKSNKFGALMVKVYFSLA